AIGDLRAIGGRPEGGDLNHGRHRVAPSRPVDVPGPFAPEPQVGRYRERQDRDHLQARDRGRRPPLATSAQVDREGRRGEAAGPGENRRQAPGEVGGVSWRPDPSRPSDEQVQEQRVANGDGLRSITEVGSGAGCPVLQYGGDSPRVSVWTPDSLVWRL